MRIKLWIGLTNQIGCQSNIALAQDIKAVIFGPLLDPKPQAVRHGWTLLLSL